MFRRFAVLLLTLAAFMFISPTVDAAPKGGDHAAEAAYSGDADHDGVPNWRDPGDDHFVIPNLAQHLFNLILLLAVMGYFAKRPITDGMRNRAANVRKQLEEAAKLRDDARAEHERLDQRLAHFAEEVEKMKANAAAEAAAEEARLMERADEAARRIAETAQANIREETLRARLALRKEAVELAVTLAEQTLTGKVSADDQRRLARQFLDSLNEDANGR